MLALAGVFPLRIKRHLPHEIKQGGGKEYGEYVFRENYYFFGGDNVIDSKDSRYIGPVPEEYIVGIATHVLFSQDYDGSLRKGRFFKALR